MNISFPVAADLLLPGWEWGVTRPETGHKDDPNWLVRHISKKAWGFFQTSTRGKALLDAGDQVVQSIRRHKKQLTTLGEDTFCLRQARSDRPAFCIDVLERGAGGDSAGDVHERAAGRGRVETEWSHAYVAMGLPLSHRSQTALLARVYNLDLAVCFARAICETLRVPVREGAISASEDDDGCRLRATFLSKLAEQNCPRAGALDGRPLRNFETTEVEPAAQAASLDECTRFLFTALGPSNNELISDFLE